GLCGEMDRILAVQNYYKNLSPDTREIELGAWYESVHGYQMNFKNPSTLNEKIQWLKLYDSTPIKTKLADKYAVRGWVKEKLGEDVLIPMIGIYECYEDIDFAHFPDQFVLKMSHGCGMNQIVTDKNSFSVNASRKKFDYWRKVYYGLDERQELHYRDIPHRIIAETYLEDLSGYLTDYKVYCFNGTPVFIQVIKNRFGQSEMSFYDCNWNVMPFYHSYYNKGDGKDPRPEQLEQMVYMSSQLAEGFSLVRVDWYLIGSKQIYFGEMTFTPASGARHWLPDGYDRILGESIILPPKFVLI
ncbi:MAG: hypothetical protein LUD12_06855, partial [Lachnospiraceae bacterium]|nr:hypothetical protein [Lachnospiraceae bacterium]